MFRFSLRTFLIVCTASSLLLVLYLRDLWQPLVITIHESCYDLSDLKASYNVMYAFERRRFDKGRLLCVRVGAGTSADHSALDIRRNPALCYGQPVPYPIPGVHLVLDRDDVRVIPLTPADVDALERVTADWFNMPGRPKGADERKFGEMRTAASPANSVVWKTKIEPEIKRLVAERNRQRKAERGTLLP